MFDYLNGEISLKTFDKVVVDIGGIGYQVFISFQTYQDLPALNQKFFFYIYPYYREDSQKLFGFSTMQERDLFSLVLSVSGVGPKVALSVLSTFSVEDLKKMIHREDLSSLVRIPGIGKKSAQRLIIDLKDKLPAVVDDKVESPAVSYDLESDVVSALVSLGYRDKDAVQSLEKTRKEGSDDNWDFESLVKKCLFHINM